ncbi:MAG: (deoxy)nucleoside triphosphate pyrophosphohydrolase [Candidatus Sumerlaeaceae bacterium]|nr:(deoxy)nucleoside triphosphate pyrophosphohydrolase [Candidatus Sumerlaeaceae bacterium]
MSECSGASVSSQEIPVVKVVAGIARQGQCVLIAQRRKGDFLGGMWEFPGGKVESGETPPDALKREFLEEFGAEIKVKNYIGARLHRYPHCLIELCAYEVELLTPLQHQLAHDDLAWVPIPQLRNFTLAPADEFLQKYLLEERTQ